ncbi:hypothetical protein CAPTEDRAFT_202100 [Capitella teleta]|uniref:Uncharacterized protein n=1 Tax=Capitella teleta TaxID=283909 RepID=R7U3J3_CAPTE|nr:hypothetical protein CAPTEDRAFT_202100 [Capitella teleta]|eukprot:ELU00701.1 hypothetical protein CAPTEDRAFT_202100 [Capitella teleta]
MDNRLEIKLSPHFECYYLNTSPSAKRIHTNVLPAKAGRKWDVSNSEEENCLKLSVHETDTLLVHLQIALKLKQKANLRAVDAGAWTSPRSITEGVGGGSVAELAAREDQRLVCDHNAHIDCHGD